MVRRATAVCVVVLLALTLAVTRADAAPPASPSPAPPAETGVAAQVVWLVDASHRLPLGQVELAAHFSPALLTAAGGVAGVNQFLGQVGPFTAGAVLQQTPTTLKQVLHGPPGDVVATFTLGTDGRLAGLLLSPYSPAPTSWAQLDAGLRTLAPRVSFAATRIDAAGHCQSVHEADGATPRPLGSAFKLYVLGALAKAVAEHRLSWDQTLPIHEAWKSLPSGVLQNEPAGTPFTLAEYADHMISISDNTAADHLIHEVGRDAVQRQLALFGNLDPAANEPFLTTRELFVLKGWHYPLAADTYLGLPRTLQPVTASLLDAVPLTAITTWTQPEKIDTLEWFGSPEDMCRAFAGLWAQHDPHVDAALSINDGGIGLSRTQFPTVWFKGGSEPGVVTLNYLVRDRSGALLAASLMLSDPTKPLDESTVDPAALALLRGAFQLQQ